MADQQGKAKYSRILLKISGEALMGEKQFGHDVLAIDELSQSILEIYNLGVQICIVVGGGNIFRGSSSVSSTGYERASSDYIGMLGTVINALILQNVLEKKFYSIQGAIRHTYDYYM